MSGAGSAGGCAEGGHSADALSGRMARMDRATRTGPARESAEGGGAGWGAAHRRVRARERAVVGGVGARGGDEQELAEDGEDPGGLQGERREGLFGPPEAAGAAAAVAHAQGGGVAEEVEQARRRQQIAGGNRRAGRAALAEAAVRVLSLLGFARGSREAGDCMGVYVRRTL